MFRKSSTSAPKGIVKKRELKHVKEFAAASARASQPPASPGPTSIPGPADDQDVFAPVETAEVIVKDVKPEPKKPIAKKKVVTKKTTKK